MEINTKSNTILMTEDEYKGIMSYKAERDTLIDDVAILKANNERLMRRIEFLERYHRMWEKITKWKQGKLAERCNNDLLHELSYTMNELERDMHKGRDK